MANAKPKTGNPLLDNPEKPVDTMKRVMKKDEEKKAAETAKKAEAAAAKKAAVEAKKAKAAEAAAAKKAAAAEAAEAKKAALAEKKAAAEAKKTEKKPKVDHEERNALIVKLNEIKKTGLSEISALVEDVERAKVGVINAKKNLRDSLHDFVESNPLLKNVKLPKRVGVEYHKRPARRADGLTVKKIILEGLKQNFSSQDIVAEVKIHFPDSNTGVADVNWYKNRISHGFFDADGKAVKK